MNSDELNNHRKGLLDERSAQTREFVNTPSSVDGNTYHLGGADVADEVTRHHDEQIERFGREW